MNKRVPLVLIMLLVTGHAIAAQTRPFKQDDSVPPELAWIRLYADKVQKNPQGYWEAELMKGIVMVYIPAGDFMMGSPKGEYGREQDEGPNHGGGVTEKRCPRSGSGQASLPDRLRRARP